MGFDGGEVISPSRQGEGKLAPILSKVALSLDVNGTPFARVRVGDHTETYELASPPIFDYIAGQYYFSHGSPASDQTINQAISTLKGKAKFDPTTPVEPVAGRVAGFGGKEYVDLCNPSWQVAEVSRDGWRIIEADDCPVVFTRYAGMQALPLPVKGGSLAELGSLLNLRGHDALTLVQSWLVMTLSPKGPYPIMVLTGEQGSSKTTTARTLKRLVDPHQLDVMALTKGDRDLMLAAKSGQVLVIDNVSRLTAESSDVLCRISTGIAAGARQLYTNSEMVVQNVCRPIVLNGIEDFATRGDLLERSVLVHLPAIDPKRRMTMEELDARFTEAHPRILGALLDAKVACLRNRGTTPLIEKPRMADYAERSAAADACFACGRGGFPKAYARNRDAAGAVALESSVLAQQVLSLVEREGEWEGTPTLLLDRLKIGLDSYSVYQLPKPNKLKDKLERITPNLRAMGIGVEYTRGKDRTVRLRRTPETTDGSDGTDARVADDAVDPVDPPGVLPFVNAPTEEFEDF